MFAGHLVISPMHEVLQVLDQYILNSIPEAIGYRSLGAEERAVGHRYFRCSGEHCSLQLCGRGEPLPKNPDEAHLSKPKFIPKFQR